MLLCYIKTKSFQMTQGGYQVMIILPMKSKMAAASAFCDFCILLNLHLRHSKSEVYKWLGLFSLVYVYISNSSRHSNLNFAHHFVIYWLFQNGANKNQHQDLYQRETVPDKFVFFQIGKAKKVNRVSKLCVCMCLENVRKEFL